MRSPVRILAVDGGGIGGIMPLRLLTDLQARYPALIDRADLVAGTSTGGLIALGLAAGKTPAQLHALYLDHGPRIFARRHRRHWPQPLLRSKFRPDGLRAAVQAIVGDSTLGELTAKPALVTVTAVRRPDRRHLPAGVFVSTAWRLADRPDRERYLSSRWPVVDLALATAAAPTYFPPHTVPDPRGRDIDPWVCWDGGLVANNPGLAALSEVYRVADPDRPDIRVLSLGTGYRRIDISAGDLGLLRAARPVIQTLMDTSVGSAAFILRQVLGDRALRLTVRLDADYEMDDPTAMPRLDRAAAEFVAAREGKPVVQPDEKRENLPRWLDRFWFD